MIGGVVRNDTSRPGLTTPMRRCEGEDWMRFMKQDRPRLRNGRRSKLLVTAVTAALVLAAPGIVLARGLSDIFTDVPNSNPFHDDISAIRGAGITNGCNPAATLYCPTDNVTREAMAAFMHRGFGRAARAHVFGTATTTEGTVATVTIAAPGNGFVVVNATADLACTCRVIMRLRDPVSSQASWYNGSVASGSDTGTTTNTFVFPVTAGTRSFDVRAFTDTGSASMWVDATAMYSPFGSGGGNVLGPSPDSSAGAAADGINGR